MNKLLTGQVGNKEKIMAKFQAVERKQNETPEEKAIIEKQLEESRIAEQKRLSRQSQFDSLVKQYDPMLRDIIINELRQPAHLVDQPQQVQERLSRGRGILETFSDQFINEYQAANGQLPSQEQIESFLSDSLSRGTFAKAFTGELPTATLKGQIVQPAVQKLSDAIRLQKEQGEIGGLESEFERAVRAAGQERQQTLAQQAEIEQ